MLRAFAKTRAPEFPVGLTWLNSQPLNLASLRGKPVLIDFWTYSCVNCLRTIPHLKRWHKMYAEKGLTIIGVHTPEFEFEKSPEHVERAIHDLGVDYPVVLDPNNQIWNLYANRYWPRKILISAKGQIVYDHAGEGAYAQTEFAIQQALTEIGVKGLPAVGPDDSFGGAVCYSTSPELYFGYLRGRVGNHDEYFPGAESVFTDRGGEQAAELPYLHGHFNVQPEYIEHTKKLPAASEYLVFGYKGFSLNVVMEVLKGVAEVEVELDNHPLPDDFFGSDVRRAPDGRAIVNLREPRMYNLVNADNYHQGKLKLRLKSDGVRLYAATFGGCATADTVETR